jgi:hypothetical protein
MATIHYDAEVVLTPRKADVLVDRCINDSRADAVHVYSELTQLNRELSSHANQPALRRGVERFSLISIKPDMDEIVDDLTVAVFDHVRYGSPATEP